MSMALKDSPESLDFGRLANNGISVRMLQSCLGQIESNMNSVSRTIRRVIREDAWLHWVDGDGGEFRHTAKQFREFLAAPRPGGCGTPVHVVERALRGTDAWEPYCKVIGGDPGGNQNPSGINQHSEVITDNVRNDLEPVILPITRDRSNDMPGGNSNISAVRWLSMAVEAGEIDSSLMDQIQAGSLSPNAAMVSAGFRKRSITIPDEPGAAAKRLLRHFSGDRLIALIEELQKGL
jgi:hypothetical protein